jgi:hypothetical protein
MTILLILGERIMRTYEISFIFNGKHYREQITANNLMRARELIYGRYEGVKIMSAREIK